MLRGEETQKQIPCRNYMVVTTEKGFAGNYLFS